VKIYIGADHRGVALKEKVVGILKALGYSYEDLGTYDEKTPCDYPTIAYQVSTRVAKSKANRGILLCMSGIGQAMAANKVKGAYAALCYNSEAAKLSRQHNNANVLVLGSKFVDAKKVKAIVKTFMTTDFEGGRHLRRVNLIKKIEKGASLK
jgi:RpiB/LacA/LacB family sugar-phosphate isomerase